MLLRGLLTTSFVLLAISGASAFHRAGNSPPTQQLVKTDPSGKIQAYYQVQVCIPEMVPQTVQRQVPITKEVEEKVNGKTRKKTVTSYETVIESVNVTIMKTVHEIKVREIDPDAVKAFETDGTAIPPKKLQQRLKKETLVVVSTNGEMIPKHYAGLFKPGTIILAQEQPMAMPPVQGIPAAPAAPASSRMFQHPPGKPRSPRILAVSQTEEDNEEPREIGVPESLASSPFPKTQPPLYVFAGRDAEHNVKIRQLTENSYEVTGRLIKERRGKKHAEDIKMIQTVRHNEITTISEKHLEFFTADGKSLPAERVKEKLSKEGTVLYSADGEAVDPFWLQNFKSTTLVLVGPQLPGGCGPVGYAMPAAMTAPVSTDAFPPSPGGAPPAPAPAPVPPEEEKTTESESESNT